MQQLLLAAESTETVSSPFLLQQPRPLAEDSGLLWKTGLITMELSMSAFLVQSMEFVMAAVASTVVLATTMAVPMHPILLDMESPFGRFFVSQLTTWVAIRQS